MIISNNQIQSIMKIYSENKISKNAKSYGGNATGDKDQVILSTKAQEFGQIYQALKASPEVRADKVKAISDSIAQGTYSVEAKDVAEKMLGRIMADYLE